MTASEVKDWLSQAYLIETTIQTLMDARKRAYEQATRTTANSGKVYVTMTANPHYKSDRLAELDNQIQRQLDKLFETKAGILRVIDGIEDLNQKNVLIKRYVNGVSFGMIADQLSYDVRHIFRIHGAALQTLALQLTEQNGGIENGCKKKTENGSGL